MQSMNHKIKKMIRDRFKNIGVLLKESLKEFFHNNSEQMGAALAYYALFSIFPFFLILFSILGYLLRFWNSAINYQSELLYEISLNSSEQVSHFIKQGLDLLKKKAWSASTIGFLVLLFSSTQVFEHLRFSLSRLWKMNDEVKSRGVFHLLKKTLYSKLFAILIIFSIGILAILSILVTAFNHYLIHQLKAFPFIGSFSSFFITLFSTLFLNTFIFGLTYKYLSGIKLYWRDVFVSALFTASLWELVKRLLSFYLSRSNYLSAYKGVEVILILMLWIYISAQILYFGASFLKVYILRKNRFSS